MPDSSISQFTSVFRASDAHRVKRCRQTVSCTACHRRKSRCDRQHPCGACEKRGSGEACSYSSYSSAAQSSGAERAAGGSGSSSSSSKRDVQLKLNKLEQMVRALAEKKAGSTNGDDDARRLSGRDRDDLETSYHGATSWTALVESIRDIQDILVADQEPGSPEEVAEPELLLGDMAPITIKEVMESLPPRQDADKLILAFFKARFVAIPFIHTHQFKRRYDAFWADPAAASFLWISIMFSILSVGAMVTSTKEPDALSSLSTPDSRFYMVKAAQCLIAGQYLKNKRFSVEALLMHAHSRNVQKLDSDSSLWALYGLVVRLAQRQGYHRDAAKIPGSRAWTPFEAEMRRRAWYLIQSTDLLFSFQNGMPPIVVQDICDAGHPTNLTDDDFDEDCVSLPAPRPPTDPLPILASITKSKLCIVMRRVVQHVLAVVPTPYSQTLALDQELRQWHSSVPACLRFRTIRNTAFTDANYTIMHRLMLQLVYLKTLCILHRPYLTTHKHDPAYNASRQVCRESALMMLELQAELDIETGSGGRMYEDRFMVSNLTLHHFLLAAMIICLDLSESTDMDSEERLKRITTLRNAYSIWSSRSTTSADALHASRVLRAILKRVDSPSSTASTSTGPVISSPDSSLVQSHESAPAIPDDAMQQTMPLGTGDMYAPKDSLFGNGAGVVMPSFEDVFANIDTFDWNSLDLYIQSSESRPSRHFFSDTSL